MYSVDSDIEEGFEAIVVVHIEIVKLSPTSYVINVQSTEPTKPVSNYVCTFYF
jgi:hypothetical protein